MSTLQAVLSLGFSNQNRFQITCQTSVFVFPN